MMPRKAIFHFQFAVLGFFILFLSGCSTSSVGTPSGFLEDYSNLEKGAYFKQEYIEKNTDFSKFKAVKIAPVSLSYLSDKTACDTAELENLGREFREDIENQLQKQGFTITSQPSGDTFVISLAITNVEPPNVLVNAGLTAATFMVPVPLPFDQDGKTSFEGKITDGTTGKILIELAEERSGSGDQMDLKAITVGKYQKFTNTQAVFAGWAQNIAMMLKDLNEGIDPGSHDKNKRKGKALTKQVIGLAV